mmetsp:Transcript_27456/g.66871  ORF Transcript_27456/g.66871 Transcript_27456/m.66871 type:complete len:223 (-) Transcript_27456:511-1179(-)
MPRVVVINVHPTEALLRRFDGVPPIVHVSVKEDQGLVLGNAFLVPVVLLEVDKFFTREVFGVGFIHPALHAFVTDGLVEWINVVCPGMRSSTPQNVTPTSGIDAVLNDHLWLEQPSKRVRDKRVHHVLSTRIDFERPLLVHLEKLWKERLESLPVAEGPAVPKLHQRAARHRTRFVPIRVSWSWVPAVPFGLGLNSQSRRRGFNGRGLKSRGLNSDLIGKLE